MDRNIPHTYVACMFRDILFSCVLRGCFGFLRGNESCQSSGREMATSRWRTNRVRLRESIWGNEVEHHWEVYFSCQAILQLLHCPPRFSKFTMTLHLLLLPANFRNLNVALCVSGNTAGCFVQRDLSVKVFLSSERLQQFCVFFKCQRNCAFLRNLDFRTFCKFSFG